MRTAILFLILLIGAAPGAQVTFQPDRYENNDSTICENAPDYEYGDEWQLWVGHWVGDVDFLIQFYELDDYLDVDLIEATLELYNDRFSGSPPVHASIYRAAEEWDEATVTWNTSPGYNSEIHTDFTITGDDYWLSLDVTGIVQSWIDDEYPHYGFYIHNNQQTSDVAYIMGGDYFLDETLNPKLILEYDDSAVVETTWGAFKANY